MRLALIILVFCLPPAILVLAAFIRCGQISREEEEAQLRDFHSEGC